MADSPGYGGGAREAREEIARRAGELADRILQLQKERQPDLEVRYGPVGMDICRQDVKYHLAYLAEAVSLGSEPLFEDYMTWVKSLFTALHLPEEDMLVNLECMEEVLSLELRGEAAERACLYLREMRERYGELPVPEERDLLEESPLRDLARPYLDALLRGDRHEASRLIMEAVERGTPVKDIYLHVFQPSQRELGRLWQMNRVSVAQEHYCTAATQLIMSQLYPRVFSGERREERLVAACVAGELHEIGLRMVSDIMEMEGWDTYYLGANTPRRSVIETIREKRPRVLAVSATMSFHVGEVAELISEVRGSGFGEEVLVIVGGYPFNVDEELWRKVGADGWAPDAEGAVRVARELCGA